MYCWLVLDDCPADHDPAASPFDTSGANLPHDPADQVHLAAAVPWLAWHGGPSFKPGF